VSNQKYQAALECVQNQKEHLHTYQHYDAMTLIENIEKTTKQTNTIKNIILQYIENDIPILVKELTELHSISVIDGDYTKKIDHETKRNEKLNVLLQHVSRRHVNIELLKESFCVEYKKVYETYLLVNCIMIELDEILTTYEQRVYHYQRLQEIHDIDHQQQGDEMDLCHKLFADLNTVLSNDNDMEIISNCK